PRPDVIVATVTPRESGEVAHQPKRPPSATHSIHHIECSITRLLAASNWSEQTVLKRRSRCGRIGDGRRNCINFQRSAPALAFCETLKNCVLPDHLQSDSCNEFATRSPREVRNHYDLLINQNQGRPGATAAGEIPCAWCHIRR